MNYLSPGVFVEEVSSGVRPIEGVGTSTCAFVGLAERGPIGVAVPISSFARFQQTFGGYIDAGFLTFAVKGFFDEGGTSCYVVRTCHYARFDPVTFADDATQPLRARAQPTGVTFDATGAAGTSAVRIDASSPGTWGLGLAVAVEQDPAITDRFDLRVYQDGNEIEVYLGLTMAAGDPDNAVDRIAVGSALIRFVDLASGVADSRPVVTAAPAALTGGHDGLANLVAADFIGDSALGSGLYALDVVEDIALLAVPEAVERDVHVMAMAYAEGRGDLFYIGSSQERPDTADDVVAFKNASGIFAGGNAISSTYGGLYTPWIEVFDPRTGGRTAVPPAGAVAGRFAATDAARGVHKVAAGVSDGAIATALGVTSAFAFGDMEKLNPKGINVIRSIPGVGTTIWGARTVSADPEWRYLNVRRLFLFARGSIEGGTRWVVFEPNDRQLWQSIARNISAFLSILWRDGALVGDTAEQAFYVKCDAETNPPESVALGRVITEIGIAPSKPAEFVVFRIQQI